MIWNLYFEVAMLVTLREVIVMHNCNCVLPKLNLPLLPPPNSEGQASIKFTLGTIKSHKNTPPHNLISVITFHFNSTVFAIHFLL